MNFTTILLIIGAIVVLLILIKLVLVVVPTILFLLIGAVPVLLCLARLFSCVTSNKPSNLKILWVIIIILAPVLGPLLWFFWGKTQT